MSSQSQLIYNITHKVSHAIHISWLAWMQQDHIPRILDTGCFTKASFYRLKEVDDTEGPTYVVQFHAALEADYERYLQDFASTFRQEAFNKWGDQFIAFRTIMEVVN